MNRKIKFYDSHLHLLGLGYNESLIDLNAYKSIDSLITIKSSKELIIGRGWHQNNFIEKTKWTFYFRKRIKEV